MSAGRMFGIGVYHAKTAENIGSLWRAAHLYGADFIFTIGARYQRQASDTSKAWQSIPLLNFKTFEDFQKGRPFGAPLVGVELTQESIPLREFNHPRQAVYLLGAEDHGLPADVLNRCQDVVVIEASQPWSMNVAAAGSVVLYDRHVKTIQAVAS